MAQTNKDSTTNVILVGVQPAPFRDMYHKLLRVPWWQALALIVISVLGLNAIYAVAYLLVGGVANMTPGSFIDAYFFSIETLATIGYGDMHPVSIGARCIVASEAVSGILVTAIATGLVFAKFSQSAARVVFTRDATISLMDDVPTLMFRVSNERGNQIFEAHLRVVLIRTETTKEGAVFYRMYDLPLVRERSPAFSRSWTAMHVINAESMLHGVTPESLRAEEIELAVSLVGTDDTSLQPVHARQRYTAEHILWGARHVDVLSEQEDGTLVLDVSKFHDVMKAPI